MSNVRPQEYMVSLDVSSPSLTLVELTRMIGASPSTSWDKGDVAFRDVRRDASVWKAESRAAPSASLELHVQDVFAQLDGSAIAAALLDPRVSATINVGVLYFGAYASLQFEPSALRRVTELGVWLSVACYPTLP